MGKKILLSPGSIQPKAYAVKDTEITLIKYYGIINFWLKRASTICQLCIEGAETIVLDKTALSFIDYLDVQVIILRTGNESRESSTTKN